MSTKKFTKKISVAEPVSGPDNHVEEVRVLHIDVKVTRDLYNAIAEAADKHRLPLGRYLALLAARAAGLPDDAAKIPMKRMGRPRKYATV